MTSLDMAAPPRSRPRAATVSTALMVAILLASAGNILMGIGLLVATVRLDSFVTVAAFVVLLLQQAYLLISLRLRQHEYLVTVVSLSLLLATGWLLTANASSPAVIAHRWFLAPFTVSTMAVLAFIRTRRRWTSIIALTIANVLLRAYYWPPDHETLMVGTLAADAGRYLALGATAVFACAAVTEAARRVDAAVELSRTARYTSALAGARASQSRSVDRFVHDEVLHTLRTIALDRSAVPAALAHQAAVDLEELLTSAPIVQSEDPGLVERLRQVAANIPLRVDVTGPDDLALPPDVEAAFASAVREALRNVLAHSGSGTAEVQVSQRGLQVSVVVTDHGRGFDVDAWNSRHGLNGSITTRMEDAGGTARVDSIPGSGTRVTMRWSPIPGAHLRAETLGQGAAIAIFPAVALVSVPSTFVAAWSWLWLHQDLRFPILVGLFAALVPLVSVAVVRQIARRGTLPTTAAIAFGGLLLLALLMGGLALPPGPGNQNWYALSLACSGGLSLLGLVRRPRELAIMCLLASLIIVTCTARLGSGLINPDYLGAITNPVIFAAVSIGVRRIADRAFREITYSEESIVSAAATAVADAEFSAALSQRLLSQREPIRDLLHQAIDRPELLNDVAFRQRAEDLERATRGELLTVGSPLAAAIERVRTNHNSLVTRLAAQLPGRVDAELAQALDSVHTTGARFTITAADLGGRWRLSLVVTPPADMTLRHGLIELGWLTDSEAGVLHAVKTIAP